MCVNVHKWERGDDPLDLLPYFVPKCRATFKHRPLSSLNVWHIARCISHQRVEGKLSQRALFFRAKYVLKTIEAFLASDDQLLSQKHIPTLKEEHRATLDLKKVRFNIWNCNNERFYTIYF